MTSSKALRRLLLVVLVIASAVAAVSCSSLIGAEDYEDSGQAICNMMVVCYGDNDPTCSKRIHQKLELASPKLRSEWLGQLTDAACLDNCVDARSCLDSLPVCNPETAGCTRKEDCCGFLTGTVDCVDSCCGAKGAFCETDADCCSNAGGCVQPFGTCGGVVCRQLDAKCVNDFDCCSKNCGPSGRCEEICSTTFCVKDTDCCDGRCVDEVCTQCVGEGQECVKGGPKPCCDFPVALQCIDTPDGQSRCGTDPTCLPPGADCTTSDRCCDDAPCVGGLCSRPCAAEGAACDDATPCCDGECNNGTCAKACFAEGVGCKTSLECCSGVCDAGVCGCSTVLCNIDANCCTGVCIGGACKPPCGTADCNHSVCQLGGPMDATAAGCSANSACIAAVCATDDYCCCGEWDVLCVNAALANTTDCSC